MRVEDQPGYILHARAYRETSLLIECLTRDYGRVGMIARGVRSARARMTRALLQPLQVLQMSWSGRGELATLVNAEPGAPPFTLAGDALLCAIYLNELVLRMTARQDPHPQMFTDYADVLERLAQGENQAWILRRFERNLLLHLGYGMVLDRDATSGKPLDPEAFYIYRDEHGPELWCGASNELRLRGSALLALAQDHLPQPGDLAVLRRLMRMTISRHLGGGILRSWNLLEPVSKLLRSTD